MQRNFFAVLFALLAILSYVSSAGASENPLKADEKFKLKLLKGTVDTRVDSVLMESASAVVQNNQNEQNNYYILQFDGPVMQEWKQSLKNAGVEFFSYIPENAFIVKIDPKMVNSMLFRPHVQYIGPYRPGYKTPASLDNKVSTVTSSMAMLAAVPSMTLRVKLFDREPLRPVINRLKKLGAIEQQEVIKGKNVHYKVKVLQNGNGLNQKLLQVVLPSSNVSMVANIPQVEWAEEYNGVAFCNNLTKPIIGALAAQSIQGRPLDGNGQTLGILDSGLDNGMSGAAVSHPAFQMLKNGHYKVTGGMAYRGDNNWSDEYDHGTFVAGIMTGYATPLFGNWSSYGGVAPQASLFVQSGQCYADYMLAPPMSTVFKDAYNKGVRIHNDSWEDHGASGELGAYNLTAWTVDTFVWTNQAFLPVFSAGNWASDHKANYPGYGIYSTAASKARPDGMVDLGSISPPATAKNCLTVGASESLRTTLSGKTYDYVLDYRRFHNDPSSTAGNVSSILGLQYSGGPENVAAFSGRGPTADGRVKPDLVAPATMVSSAMSHLPDNIGDFSPDFSAFPNDINGSTSYAAPLVSGAAGLVEQYYHDFYGINPSAALVKATLINGAVDLSGRPDSEHYTSNRYGNNYQPSLLPMTRPDFHQGWGRLDIMSALYPGQTDGAASLNTPASILIFKDVAPGFKTGPYSGADYCFSLKDPSPGKVRIRVTLVWTDYPGTPTAATELVNHLELTVIDPYHNVHVSSETNFSAVSEKFPYYDTNAPIYSTDSSGYDTNDNVRSIEFINDNGGDFIVQVHALNVPMGPQPYALVITGDVDAQVSQPDTTQTVNVSLSPSMITGKVVLQTGTPNPNYSIYTVTASGPTIRRATCGADGTFTIKNVQSAKYYLNAYLGEPTPGNLKSVIPNVLYTTTATPATATLTVKP